ncbi:MAG: leucine--tRNA ligase [Proteobacteria bacterium]|nr:leucine--tRNA ligase [Pseudomonadota bacterium]
MQDRPDSPAAAPVPAYDPSTVEAAAQAYWSKTRAFEVNEADPKPKFYCLSMLPYPSGALHMGHVRNYTIGDVISRFQRMLGKNVLQPMGWDAFGLPAENAAIKNKTAPAKWTYANIAHMREQLATMGYAIDWTREFATCKPNYYVHEQRMFVRLFKKGLAYRKQSVVNWDPVDHTVLANEQVIDGRGWRTGAPVEKREIPQWFLKITDYAQQLLDGLDQLPGWPDSVKTMQRNWIGRSEGLEIAFDVDGQREPLTVFTTRPDTLMGVSFLSIAAEHPLAQRAAARDAKIAAFIDACRHGGTATADIETQEKKGIDTGFHAIHPISGERVPVWIANFVLMGYGTGAVMGVPGHDQRDWEFATKYDLLIKMVIVSDPVRDAILEVGRDAAGNADAMTAALGEGRALDVIEAEGAMAIVADFEQSIIVNGAYTEYGTCVNSGELDGMGYEEAFAALAERLEREGRGRRRVNFRLRDWGVSRQRYWGCPIPIIYCDKCGAVPVPEEQLPVLLPEDVAFMGTGSPIKADPQWRKTTCPQCGGAAERETDTFDTFMESSWYYARYTSPGAADMVDVRARHWLPVDHYIGGIEHAILHLLYFRFFHKLLRDAGLVDSDEPATRLLCQGMVIAETFYREDAHGAKDWINPADVEMQRDARGHVVGATLKADGKPVQIGPIEKMSKSKNNGVDPQAMVGKYGADTVRLFSMFAAPPEQSLEWSEAGVEGCARFLRRLWGWGEKLAAQTAARGRPGVVDAGHLDAGLRAARREIHQHVAQADYDMRRLQFNTVVSAAMKILRVLEGLPLEPAAGDALANDRLAVQYEGYSKLLRLLNPMTPHFAHAMWQKLGNPEQLIEELRWPAVDAAALQRDAVKLAVQVNGKLRGTIEVAVDAPREAIEQAALAEPNVARFLDGQQVCKLIVVPGKIVNIVAAA